MTRPRPGDLRAALAPVLALRRDRAEIDRLRSGLLGPSVPLLDDDLADAIAAVLAVEPAGVSCDELARRSHRRRMEVRRVLHSDQRFAHRGNRRGSRWQLVAPPPTLARDGRGRTDEAYGVLSVAAPIGEDSGPEGEPE